MLERLPRHGLRLARTVLQNKTLRASAVFALSGLAFALGNLLLARAMPVVEFGRAALEISLLNLFAVVGPLGLDQVLLRRGAEASSKVIGHAVAVNGAVACIAAAIAHLFYGLPSLEAALVAVAIAAAGSANVASAGMRAHGREGVPLAMIAGTNLLLLLSGVYGVAAGGMGVPLMLATVATGNVLIAASAWSIFAARGSSPEASPMPVRWSEAISLLGLVAVGALAVQLERFIIPKTLGGQSLAVFSVLASVSIFPFRLVTSGAGFALTPQLRRAKDIAERQSFVARELRAIAALLAVATAVIVAAAPTVTQWLTGDRYHLSHLLVLTACLSGSVKVIQSLIRAVVIGCGSHRAILLLNAMAWLSIFVSALAGVLGSRWGLEGLIAGAALGALMCNVPALAIAVRSIRTLR